MNTNHIVERNVCPTCHKWKCTDNPFCENCMGIFNSIERTEEEAEASTFESAKAEISARLQQDR